MSSFLNERLLQYIWQFQYFNKSSLVTTDSQPLQIIHPGVHNTNQGPDFLNAKIRTGDTTWAGNIELHVHSSDWKKHQHSKDTHYNNVILHVVWNDEGKNGPAIPTLELKNIVPKLLLNKYEDLMNAGEFIPCENQLKEVDHLIILHWKDRLMIERLQERSFHINHLLMKTNMHWEEVFWWMIARNFGGSLNGDAFEKMARGIPVNLLAKHKSQLIQLEAMLMGQAGLLKDQFEEDYPILLKKEYAFLQKKYQLKNIHLPILFHRMRPANFPTLRLAQLASLVHQSDHLFSRILEAENATVIEKILSVTANDYWHYHYIFDETAGFKVKTLGNQMIGNILVNTVIPVLYAYGYLNNNELFKNKALEWLNSLPPEKNNITKVFQHFGVENKTAGDSQALIQLKNEYCRHKRCLQCSIGNNIIQIK